MRRFKIAFFLNAVLLMCITYLSRDSCRNLICKNLGILLMLLSSSEPASLHSGVPLHIFQRNQFAEPPFGSAVLEI